MLPSRAWLVGWGIAIAVVLAPVIGPIVLLPLWMLAWLPMYFVMKGTGLGHGNWTALVLTWAIVALAISRLHHRPLGPPAAWGRAAFAVFAVVALLEASAITVCRINQHAAAPETRRTCYPHVAGWLATAHLRQTPRHRAPIP